MRTTHVSALLGLAAGAAACAPDFNSLLKRTHCQPLTLSKRDEQWPPVLSEHETILVNSFDNNTVDQWSYYYGRQDKLAGYGKEAAEVNFFSFLPYYPITHSHHSANTSQWTRDQWAANGFDAHLNEYNVFLRYPVSTSLTFTDAEGNTSEVNINEDILEEDEVTGWDALSQQSFLGYAAGGSASAEYVYAG